MRLNEFTTVGGPNGPKGPTAGPKGPKGPKDYGQPNSSRYIGGAKFVVGTTLNYILTATVDKWGLEWDDDDEIWFLESSGSVDIADASEGEIELPDSMTQHLTPGNIHDLVTEYLNDHNSDDLQQVAAHFGHTPDGEMANEGVRVAAQQIPGTKNRAKSAYYPTNVPPKVKKLDKPLTDKELSRLTNQGVKEDSISEFARSPRRQGGSGGEDYFKSLAQAWYYNGVHSGDLHGGIKTQEDVERLLQRGIVAPDGELRKYNIDYNSGDTGVVIYSDDYYEYGDNSGNDSRTRKPFGPYDYMEFTDEELDESVNQGVKEGKRNLKCVCKTHSQDQCPIHAPLAEGAEFGSYYVEELAQKVFDLNPNLSTSGLADELLDAAWPIAVKDLGKQSAQYRFTFDEDFRSDVVSMYAQLQKQNQGMAEADMTRRGFLQFGAAAGVAGLGAATDAQARANPEWQAKVEQAKELLAKGLTPEQVAKKLGVSGPNNGMAGPMSGDWGAINYAVQEIRRAKQTGMSEGKRDHRDPEHHELDAPRPLIYGLKINGKIWKKDGNTVTFFTKERALTARTSMLNKKPELEITLIQKPKD